MSRVSEPFRPVIDIEHVDDYPWSIWPPRYTPTGLEPFTAWKDITAWAREEAEDLWADRELDPGPDGVDFVAGTLERCAEAFCPPESDHWLFLHLDRPTDLPLPVLVAIGPSSGPRTETLRELTLADDPDAVEPPVVKPFKARILGEGLSAFRYIQQTDSPHLIACLRYAWRIEEHGADIVMRTSTEDVGHLLEATEDLEELAHTLAVHVP